MIKDLILSGACFIVALAIFFSYPICGYNLLIIGYRLLFAGLAFGFKAAYESEKEF